MQGKLNYKLLQLLASVFCILLALSCSQIVPTGPEGPPGTPNPLYEQQDTTPPVPADPFNISITFTAQARARLKPYQVDAIARACAHWERVIVNGLPDIGGVDDVYISVHMGKSEEWLADARYSFSHRRADTGLPYVGYITIHPLLLDPAYTRADWERIMIHEIAHVLGFDLYMLSEKGLASKEGEQWYFTGAKAINAYRDILYQMGEKLSYAIADLRVPMHSDGAHWHNSAMAWELLSPTYSTSAALSAVTLSALADIGYTVDMSRAEAVSRTLTKLAMGTHFFCDGRHISVAK